MVRNWIADMQAEGLSASRIKQAKQVLSAPLELAVVDGIIARSPTTGVKVPTVRRREQRFLAAGKSLTSPPPPLRRLRTAPGWWS